MTGRGRGRLFREQKNPDSNSIPLSSADIKDLSNGPRSPHEIYKILKSNIIEAPFSSNKLRSSLELIISNMIQDPTNAIEICKYLYICSCSTDRTVGSAVLSQFFSILETKFTEIQGKGDQINEDNLYNFTKFFVTAIHFMRNPEVPPKADIVKAILILIERLNKSLSDCRNLYCQAVGWVSSYLNRCEEDPVLLQAFYECVEKVRDWILDGSGGHWAMACLESISNRGQLPPQARGYYSKKLPRSQYSSLTETSHNILIPAPDKRKYNLPNLHCINYID